MPVGLTRAAKVSLWHELAPQAGRTRRSSKPYALSGPRSGPAAVRPALAAAVIATAVIAAAAITAAALVATAVTATVFIAAEVRCR